MLAALTLLSHSGPQSAFLAAGFAVEILGLVLFVRAHLTPKEDRD